LPELSGRRGFALCPRDCGDYETTREWCQKFGERYANQSRHRRPKPGDKWHLDEVFLAIHGKRHDL
jgi:putative transposase